MRRRGTNHGSTQDAAASRDDFLHSNDIMSGHHHHIDKTKSDAQISDELAQELQSHYSSGGIFDPPHEELINLGFTMGPSSGSPAEHLAAAASQASQSVVPGGPSQVGSGSMNQSGLHDVTQPGAVPQEPFDGSGLSQSSAPGGAGPDSVFAAGPRASSRRNRRKWTEEETSYLVHGCRQHGVGNWKKILLDPAYRFNDRTAVDLKDRFRTSFPEEYSRLYPNARTHKSRTEQAPARSSGRLVKVNRKDRLAFSPEEDSRLLQGFLKHGASWSKIQRDKTLGLQGRRSTDLRDRFRNAFPDRYTAAGYKGRVDPKKSAERYMETAKAEAAEYMHSSSQIPRLTRFDDSQSMALNPHVSLTPVPYYFNAPYGQ